MSYFQFDLLDNHNILAESRDYQKNSTKIKSYNKDAGELLSTGPAKHPYASGIKDVDTKRGKSAPPGAPGGGWGPIGEEKDEKPRPKLKIRFLPILHELALRQFTCCAKVVCF